MGRCLETARYRKTFLLGKSQQQEEIKGDAVFVHAEQTGILMIFNNIY